MEVQDSSQLRKRKRAEDESTCSEALAFRRRTDARQCGSRDDLSLDSGSIVDTFDEHASCRSSTLAVMELPAASGISLSWKELQEQSIAIGSSLFHALSSTGTGMCASEAVAVLMHRSCLWLSVTLAVLRCGRPFVWLSAGEVKLEGGSVSSRPQKVQARESKHWLRNSVLLGLTEPCAVVVGESVNPEALSVHEGNASTAVIHIASLMGGGYCGAQLASLSPKRPRLLCYMFTGGSTGSPKCVQVTHSMALHEVQRYPHIASLSSKDRVLQHTSVFWAASVWGQVDIALAFGAGICISKSATPSMRDLCEAHITVLGAAPSTLASMILGESTPVSCIFSWGEALPHTLGARWRAQGIKVVELLISTEYWLSFYNCSAREGPAVFQVAGGVDFAVLPSVPDSVPTLAAGAVGELCIRGPAVTPGYTRKDADADHFVESPGGRYFRTKDVVKVVSDKDGFAVQFHGRSDALIKVGADFVNLTEVGQRLEQINLCGGLGVCALPPRQSWKGPSAHIFVAAREAKSSPQDVVQMVSQARSCLPHGVALHVLEALPRDVITGKVERRVLLDHVSACEAPNEPLSQRLQEHMIWRVFRRQFILCPLVALCFFESIVCLLLPSRYHSPYRDPWYTGMERTILLPYVWLFSMHTLPNKCVDVVPFGRLGTVMAVLLCDATFSSACARGQMAWFLLSAMGIGLAGIQGLQRCSAIRDASTIIRFGYNILCGVLAWQVAFWAAVPHTLFTEAIWWLSPEAWFWWVQYGLPRDAPLKVRDSIAKSSQCACARRCISRTCFNVGSTVEVWSMSQRLWLRGRVVRKDGLWVTVRYCWPDGQEYDKELSMLDGVIRSARLAVPAKLIGIVISCCLAVLDGACKLCSAFNPLKIWKARESSDARKAAQSASTPQAHPPRDSPKGSTLHQDSRPTECVSAPGADVSMDAVDKAVALVQNVVSSEHGQGENSLHSKTDQEYGPEYRGYVLRKWCFYEHHWWNKCTMDYIDIECEAVGRDAPSAAVDDSAAAAAAAAAASPGNLQGDLHGPLEGRVCRLIEKHLQVGLPLCASTRLAGADSLSFMALCRGVRAELRVELQPEVAMRCETVGELVQRVDEEQRSQASKPDDEFGHQASHVQEAAPMSYAVYFAPSQWVGTCKWLYRADGVLDPEIFAVAVNCLVDRHEALRYTLLDPLEQLSFVQHPAAFHLTLAHYFSQATLQATCPQLVKRLASLSLHTFQRILGFGLKGAWPSIGPSTARGKTEPFVPRVVWCSSWHAVTQGVRKHSRDFQPPFSVALFLAEAETKDEGPQSYVHFVCTHAFSDGFTAFPLINDLAELYEAERVRRQTTSATPGASTDTMLQVCLPSAFGVLQQRLFDALEVRPMDDAPDQCSLRITQYWPAPSDQQGGQYNHIVQLQGGAVDALRACCRNFAVPLDIVLLGMVSGALLRTGVSDSHGRSLGCSPGDLQLLTLILYAPMRDGPSNEAMVGLFSDWREINITDSPQCRLTVLGLILELTTTIRARQWAKCDPLQNSERILVNILALDERPRGGFHQTRRHEYTPDMCEPDQRGRFWTESCLRPMRITIEQFTQDRWWFSLDLSHERFPPAWCRQFVVNLEQTLHDLVYRPLSPVV